MSNQVELGLSQVRYTSSNVSSGLG